MEKQSIYPFVGGYILNWPLPTIAAFHISREDNCRPIYYPYESLSWPSTLLSRRTTIRTMDAVGVVYVPGLFIRDHLSLLQRPNAALARPPARHVGNLVTAFSCRTSRPSRLTGARTWRWVRFTVKAFSILLDLLSILNVLFSPFYMRYFRKTRDEYHTHASS